MNDTVIRKVSVLRGRAKDEAERQGLDPDDLVIVTTSVHPLPEYHIEKVVGDPVSYLLSKDQSSEENKEENDAAE